jgi:hypothetical protein
MKSKIAIKTQVLLLKFSLKAIFHGCHSNTKTSFLQLFAQKLGILVEIEAPRLGQGWGIHKNKVFLKESKT